MRRYPLSEARTNDVAAAVAHIEQAMEIVERLHRSPREGISTNGIVTVLSETVRRIKALEGDDGE
jgi:hypothetical protein